MSQGDDGAQRKPIWKKLTARLAGSTFLLTVLGLVSIDAVAVHVKPLRFVNHTGLTSIRQNYLVAKLPDLLQSPISNDVVLTGSSTMLVPAVRCDDQLHGRRARFDPWFYRNYINECIRCDYLEKQLSEKAHKTVSLTNLAVSASIVSDQYLLMNKYLRSGKHPKLAIVSVAPREFLDNDRQNIEKTAVYSLLADFDTLPEIIKQGVDPWRICDAALGMTWTYYRTRGDYRTFCETLAVKTSGHPLTLFNATANGGGPATAGGVVEDEGVSVLKGKPDYQPKPNILKDMGEYKRMYFPVNNTQFATQSEYFDKLLALLKKENVATLVVDMPVTEENLALLPPAVLTMYRDTLQKQCSKYGATLVSPASTTKFSRDDFEDSVHMNLSGGHKLFTAISNAVAAEPRLAGSIGGETKSIAGTGSFR